MSAPVTVMKLGTGFNAPRRSAEEKLDARRERKRLRDCSLPENFRLVYPEPKQMVVGGLLRRAFCLEYAPDGFFLREERLFHLHVYEEHVPDEVQLRWALLDFKRELEDEGYAAGEIADLEIPTSGHKRNYSIRNYSQRTRSWQAS